MKQLPQGVYIVSASLTPETAVTFRGDSYCTNIGINAFPSFEELVKADLTAAPEALYGHSGSPIILVPNGTVPIGEIGTVPERFRTVFPRAVTILGDTDSVIKGSFYFGSLTLTGETDGAFTMENLTLACRVADTRTGGQQVSLTLRNCRLTAPIPSHLVTVGRDFAGHRTTLLEDCTVENTPSMNADGGILYLGSGEGTMRRLTTRSTPKFPGMSNYARTATTPFTRLTVEDCDFLEGSAIRGFSFVDGGQVIFRNCRFCKPTLENVPVIWAKNTPITLENCLFSGDSDGAAVYSNLPVAAENCQTEGYRMLYSDYPVRRTAVDATLTYPLTDPHTPTYVGGGALDAPQMDFSPLNRLYAGRTVAHGDFHCHSNSGGTSDGKTPLADYVPTMQKLQMDFAAIVDHRQMRHFHLPEWDETYLICGTEPGQYLNDPTRDPIATKMDYTMIFPDKQGFAKVMEAFPEFHFKGTALEGSYHYWNPTPQRFRELAEFVYSIGGLLSHAHPKQLMVSDNPLDYYFGEHMALETVHGDPAGLATWQNRRLWQEILKLGKHTLTHGSSDSHGDVSNRGLTTIYVRERHSRAYFEQVRSGDCTAGAMGIQMCIDEAVMGSQTTYAPGKILYVKAADLHPAHQKPDTVYTLRIYTDKGLAYAREFAGEDIALALPIQDRLFYRAEVYNESDDHVISLSNPIFLTK